MTNQEIPIVSLDTTLPVQLQQRSVPLLVNEIAGIDIEHISLAAGASIIDFADDGYKLIYLFIKGSGEVLADDQTFAIVPETVFLPNNIQSITINSAEQQALHYLRISSALSAQDQADLIEFPAEHTQEVYYAKFTDCQAYTEPIKSPNTVSRTILPNKIIPRIAMGTVQTIGPDAVGAHEHPMLEQLFLGLADNSCTVYADDAEVNFSEHSLLHIPLGSRHSVSVAQEKVMYYVWMDFFLDKKGEEWLKTHIVEEA